MILINRVIFLSAVTALSFVFVHPALAEDCQQKRKTPQAPHKTYKQTNPLKATPENISAGEKIYKKGAKPLACIQCHGVNGKGDGKMERWQKA
jgi:mono/diheme cytochrome c family protein